MALPSACFGDGTVGDGNLFSSLSSSLLDFRHRETSPFAEPGSLPRMSIEQLDARGHSRSPKAHLRVHVTDDEARTGDQLRLAKLDAHENACLPRGTGPQVGPALSG